jgi:hypothetical protein
MIDMDEFRRFIILLQTEVRTRWLESSQSSDGVDVWERDSE